MAEAGVPSEDGEKMRRSRSDAIGTEDCIRVAVEPSNKYEEGGAPEAVPIGELPETDQSTLPVTNSWCHAGGVVGCRALRRGRWWHTRVETVKRDRLCSKITNSRAKSRKLGSTGRRRNHVWLGSSRSSGSNRRSRCGPTMCRAPPCIYGSRRLTPNLGPQTSMA